MRETNIYNSVYTHYKECKSQYGESNMFVTMLYGSQNYNLDTPNSDVDTKTMIFPSINDVILGRKMVSTDKVMPDGSLSNVKDYRAMFGNYLKGNINFVETLFTDFYVVTPKYMGFFDRLLSQRDLIANCQPLKLVHMAAGMANQKYVAMEKPFESKKEVLERYGYDFKQLLHLARLDIFIKKYCNTGDFGACLVPCDKDREWLKGLKTNPISLSDARQLKEETMNKINATLKWADSNLPLDKNKKEAQEFLDNLAVDLFKEVIYNNFLIA